MPDRSAAGGQYGLLDGLRAWIEQGLRSPSAAAAVAPDAHDHTRTGGASVVGRRCGDPVAAELRCEAEETIPCSTMPTSPRWCPRHGGPGVAHGCGS